MAKKFGFILVLVFAFSLAGCAKKQDISSEAMQEPMSMEDLSASSSGQAKPSQQLDMQATTAQPAVSGQAKEVKLEPLPPAGPYKPTVNEIQTALKNAGYYTGSVDGKSGPLTKKAVEEFQKANNLKADGKVGPKTWEILSRQLNAPSQGKKR